MPILLLLGLTFPIFYIWGLISCIRWFVSLFKNSSTATSSLVVPKRTAATPAPSTTLPVNIHTETRSVLNTTDLMLYLGAFLIIAAASIFVGFQWEAYSGTLKSSLLTLVAFAFLGTGVFLTRFKKIAQAGWTFTAIGALMAPFCAIGWYNFVLKEQGFAPASIWITTSILSMGLYLALAIWSKSRVYAYCSSLSILSFFLSLTKVVGLSQEFYILNALGSAYMLLITSHLIKGQFVQPFRTSSSIITPTALLFGFQILSSGGTWFSLPAALAAFLSAGYYFVYYILTPQPIYLLVSQALLPLGIVFLAKTYHLGNFDLLLVLNTIALVYGVAGIVWRDIHPHFAASQTLSLVCLFLGLALGLPTSSLIVLTLFPLFISIYITLFDRQPTLLYLSTVLANLLVFLLCVSLPNLAIGNSFHVVTYLILGALVYGAHTYLGSHKDLATPTLVISGWFLMCAFVLATSISSLASLSALTLALYFAHLGFTKSKPHLYYLSSLFSYICVGHFLAYLDFPSAHYSIALAGASLIAYFIPIRQYQHSALLGAFLASFIGPNTSTGLYVAYFSTILTATDAYLHKSERTGYIASGVGLVALTRQYAHLDISHVQIYSATIGIYFLVLSYLRHLKSDVSNRHLADFLGLAFLFLPTLFQSFSSSDFSYSLLLGAYGLGIFFLGSFLNRHVYSQVGIAAIVATIISQTYQYVFSLPWWLIVAIVGLAFLGLAIFTLARRKE